MKMRELFVSALVSAAAILISTSPAFAQPPLPATNPNLTPQVAVASSSGNLSLYAFDTGSNTFAKVAENNTGKTFVGLSVEDVDNDAKADYVTIQGNGGTKEIQVWGFNAGAISSKAVLNVTSDIAGDLISVSTGRVQKNTIVVQFRVSGDEDHIRVYSYASGAITPHSVDSGDYAFSNGAYAGADYQDSSTGAFNTGTGGDTSKDSVLFVRGLNNNWLGFNTLNPRSYQAPIFAWGFAACTKADAFRPLGAPAGAAGGDLFAPMHDPLEIQIFHPNASGNSASVTSLTDLSESGANTQVDLCGAGLFAGQGDDVVALFNNTGVKAIRAIDYVGGTPNTISWRGTAVRVDANAVAIDGLRQDPPPPGEPTLPPAVATNANVTPRLAVVFSNGDLNLYGLDGDHFAKVTGLATAKHFVDVSVSDLDNNGTMNIVTITTDTKELTVWNYSGSTISSQASLTLSNVAGDPVSVGTGVINKDAIAVHYRVASAEDAFRVYRFTGSSIIPHPDAPDEYPISDGQYAGATYNDMGVGDLASGWTAAAGSDDAVFCRKSPAWIGANQLIPRSYHTPIYAASVAGVALDMLSPENPPVSAGGGDLYAECNVSMDTGVYAGVQGAAYTAAGLGDAGLSAVDLTGVNLGGAGDTIAMLYSYAGGTVTPAFKAIRPAAISATAVGWGGTAVSIATNAVALDGARTGVGQSVPPVNSAEGWTIYR